MGILYQEENGIRDRSPYRGLGEVYKRKMKPVGKTKKKTSQVIVQSNKVKAGDSKIQKL